MVIIDERLKYKKTEEGFVVTEGIPQGKLYKVGKNFKCGAFVIIEDDVIIGNNVTIGDFALIKKGTVIEDDVFFDSFCISSGNNRIGKGSQIRYQSIVARNVEIGKNVFFCAGVKTAYLEHDRSKQSNTLYIADEVFVGDNATILSGLSIARGSVIGAHSLVTKNLTVGYSVYMGCPAKYVRNLRKEEIDAIQENLG